MIDFISRARRFLGKLASDNIYVESGDLLNFSMLLNRYLADKETIEFVQIGANDGFYVDPLHDFMINNYERISGVVVEPMTRAFKELEETYKNYPMIEKLNAAIHNEKKKASLYQIDPERLHELPEFYKGIASFDSTHFDKTYTPKEYIIEEEVTCHTLDEVLEKYSIEKLDLLQIDAEGYDAEIINGIDFDKVSPGILRFEHGLSQGIMSTRVFMDIVHRLNSAGYQVVCERYDAVAFRIDDFV